MEHIQLDIADFIKDAEENEGFRYALAGLDAFSRYGWLVPMKTKQPHNVISALKEIMRVIGVPKSSLAIWEGLYYRQNLLEYKMKLIKQITTSNHAAYAEVFI